MLRPVHDTLWWTWARLNTAGWLNPEPVTLAIVKQRRERLAGAQGCAMMEAPEHGGTLETSIPAPRGCYSTAT